MRVEFENSPGDFFRYARALPRALRWHQQMQTLLLLAVLSLPGMVILAIAGTAGGMIAAGIWMLFFCGLFWLLRRRAERRLVSVMQHMAIELKPDCLRFETGQGWTERDWSGVRRVHESAECWLISVSDWNFCPVSKAAFASAAEAERFAAELHRLVAEGARSAAPRLKPTIPNLAQALSAPGAAAQVSFVTTAPQLYDANQHAASPNTKLVTNGAAVRSAILMAGIGIAIMYIYRDPHPSLTMQVVAFTLFVLAMLSLLRFWIRARSHRFVDPIMLGPRTLTLTPEGLWWTGPSWQAYSRWEDVSRAQKVGELLALYSVQPQALAAIPLSAFASEIDADTFLATVTMYQGMAQHRQQAQLLPMVTVVSDNPYQPPSTM